MIDSFQEDIIELRNFKQKNKLKKMVVHSHVSNMDNSPFWIYIAVGIEKLIPGTEDSYMIGNDDTETGYFPLITTNSLYFIELENDGEECLKQIEYYKKRCEQIKKKLSSVLFISNASVDIVDLERKRLTDFETRHFKASLGYLYV